MAGSHPESNLTVRLVESVKETQQFRPACLINTHVRIKSLYCTYCRSTKCAQIDSVYRQGDAAVRLKQANFMWTWFTWSMNINITGYIWLPLAPGWWVGTVWSSHSLLAPPASTGCSLVSAALQTSWHKQKGKVWNRQKHRKTTFYVT